jgi:hypothetical protein
VGWEYVERISKKTIQPSSVLYPSIRLRELIRNLSHDNTVYEV